MRCNMSWCIYKHTSPSGKHYIGYTKQKPEARWKNGNGYGADTKFGKAIAKYGWDNFSHEILEVNIPTLEEAKQSEINWISFYDSFYNGYNSTFGGDGIDPEKVRKVAVLQFDANLKQIAEYESIKEASEKTGISQSNIEAATKLNGNQFKAGGYYWCKKENYTKEWRPRADLRSQPIICVETKTIYPSMEIAALDNNINNAASISLCCTGKCITAGGLHWAYLKDYNENWKPKEAKPKDYSRMRRKIICYETQKIYESISAAAAELGICRQNITRACKEHRLAGGKHFAYFDEFNEQWTPRPEYHPTHLNKKIICIETGEEFASIRAANAKLGIAHSLIARCCSGELKQTHNLTFKYKNEE